MRQYFPAVNKTTKLCWLLIIISIFSINSMTQTTVRSYLKLVNAEFFGIACCDGNVDKYPKKYITVEDNANGCMKGEDEG
jgi:hypothetical protein